MKRSEGNDQINPFNKDKMTINNVLITQHTHTEPAADDSLGEAVHVGIAGVCMKPVHHEEKKKMPPK